ncbi:glycosyltransferase [bacterium]|nr:glycosyltransferase [bacterium]
MNIIIINNAAKESTVLKAFLPIVYSHYEKVSVVFPSKLESANAYNIEHNIKLCIPTLVNKIMALIYMLKLWCLKFVFQDLKLANKQNKLSIKYFVAYFRYLYSACVEYIVAEQELRNLGSETHVFSMWYSHNALAAAMLKKQYPQIVAASYAHSYEVDLIKNRYVGLLADRFKEKYLDRIFFISEVVMKNYIENNREILSFTQKYKALHFGSVKKYNQMCEPSKDGAFRILTCSGISPVKRLDILADALKIVNSPIPIIWTIFGDGSLKDKISSIVSEYDGIHVKAVMRGSVSNAEVHKYYIENPVDLFVNISSSEGLPVSIMEAMSYGVPTLATDVGGNREIVNTDTGLLIPADIQPFDVAQAITALVKAGTTQKRDAAYSMWKDSYQINDNVLQLLSELGSLNINRGE